MKTPEIPLLVVDDIRRDPQKEDLVEAHIHLGGHPLKVVLDFDFEPKRLGFAGCVEIPWMLQAHLPSHQAVIHLMRRFHKGDQVDLPVDLSEEIARSDPPSPFRFDPDKDRRVRPDDPVLDLDLMEMHRTGTYPAVFQGVIRINGKPIEMHVELYAGPGRVPAMKTMRCSPKLTAAESSAVWRRLLQEVDCA
jgi:hypothetical protein